MLRWALKNWTCLRRSPKPRPWPNCGGTRNLSIGMRQRVREI